MSKLIARQQASVRRIGEQGFTLVEMLVVITIIALIMGLVGPRVLNFLGESKVKAAKFKSKAFRVLWISTFLMRDITRPVQRAWRH